MKKYGLLANSARGIWSLNQTANALEGFDPQKVVQFVRALDRKVNERTSNGAAGTASVEDGPIPEVSEEQEWKQQYTTIESYFLQDDHS